MFILFYFFLFNVENKASIRCQFSEKCTIQISKIFSQNLVSVPISVSRTNAHQFQNVYSGGVLLSFGLFSLSTSTSVFSESGSSTSVNFESEV